MNPHMKDQLIIIKRIIDKQERDRCQNRRFDSFHHAQKKGWSKISSHSYIESLRDDGVQAAYRNEKSVMVEVAEREWCVSIIDTRGACTFVVKPQGKKGTWDESARSRSRVIGIDVESDIPIEPR